MDSTADLPLLDPDPQVAQNVDFVLFDLGGVLVDVDQRRAEVAWERAGHAPRCFHAAFYETGAKPQGDLGVLDAEGMRARAQSATSLALDSQTFQSIWGAVVSWRPWVDALLARLTVPYGVLSTIDPVHAAALGPLPGAEPILYSCDLGAVKPDPAVFATAAMRCSVPPERVRYVDDLAENVAAARAAGFDAHQVVTREQLLRALSGLLGDELEEVRLGDDL